MNYECHPLTALLRLGSKFHMSSKVPNQRRRCNHLDRDIEPDIPEVVVRFSNRAIANTVTLAGSSSICPSSFSKLIPRSSDSPYIALWGHVESSPGSLAVSKNGQKGGQILNPCAEVFVSVARRQRLGGS